MKICEYCGTENQNNAVKCSSCGGVDFKYKCDNCGTVFKGGVHCPHCGVKAGQEARVCPVCNTEYYSNACPTCGYVPSAQKVNHDAPVQYAKGVTPPPGYVPPQPVQTPPQPAAPKRKTWLWVLGWIFIFPLPLTLILVKKKDMNNVLKYTIIVLAWLFYIGIGYAGKVNNSSTSANPYAPQQVVSSAAQNSAP